MANRQLRFLPILPNAPRRNPRKALTPQDFAAQSEAEAERRTRAARHVYKVGGHFEVISTDSTYRHIIVLKFDGEGTLGPICVAAECKARREHPCWAIGKTILSQSFREAYRAKLEAAS